MKKLFYCFLILCFSLNANAATISEICHGELTVVGDVSASSVIGQAVSADTISSSTVFTGELTIGNTTTEDPYLTFESTGGDGILQWETTGDYFVFDHRVDVLGNVELGQGAADEEVSIGFDAVGSNSRLKWSGTEQLFSFETATVAAPPVDLSIKDLYAQGIYCDEITGSTVTTGTVSCTSVLANYIYADESVGSDRITGNTVSGDSAYFGSIQFPINEAGADFTYLYNTSTLAQIPSDDGFKIDWKNQGLLSTYSAEHLPSFLP